MFDEPVNGLDPEGILWIRHLMRSLASQGRTVFVSSHLMSEMAVTADHLIVIGRGRLLADTSTRQFVDGNSTSTVRVRSPQSAELADVLAERGHPVREVDGALEVSDATTEQVGDAAATRGLTVHELYAQRSSLEDVFMELTRDSVEYSAEAPAAREGQQVPASGGAAR
jgi:ABC-2 type transport system ATP-binding protein